MFVSAMLAWAVAQIAVGMAGALAVQEASASEEPSPMRKVVHMLEDMKKELEHEAENEAEIFDKAMCACETGEKDLKKVIEDATSQIADATAKIATESAEHSKLKKELVIHKTEKEEGEATLAKGAEIRSSEHKKFEAGEVEAANSIDQLDKAISALTKKNRGAALMQMTSLVMKAKSYLSEADHHSMLSFLGTRLGARAGSPGSDTIIGILKTLHEEMSNDLDSLRKTEQAGEDEYLSMKQEKERQVKAAMEAQRDKQQRVGALALSLQDAQDTLEDAQNELEKAQEYLAAMQEQCSRKEKDRAMRKEIRNEEIVAIGEAMKVMNDDDARETVNKALPRTSLLQRRTSAPVSLPIWDMDLEFVQTAARSRTKVGARREEPDLFMGAHSDSDSDQEAGWRDREKFAEGEENIGKMFDAAREEVGEKKGSTEKGKAAVRAVIAKQNAIKAANWKPEKDVNRIVRGIVTDMSYGLHKTDVQDEMRFDYCTKEIATNEAIQKKKQTQSQVLTSQVEKTAVTIEPLEKEIKLLEESINAQDQQVLDQTAQRKREHDEFSTGYVNMGQAIKIINEGMKILKKFYSPSLLQWQSNGSQRAHSAAHRQAVWQDRRNVQNMENKLMPEAWDESDDRELAQLRKRQLKAAQNKKVHRISEIQEAEIHRVAASLAPPDWDDDSLLQVHSGHHRVEPVVIPDTPTTYIKKESGGVIGMMQQMITEIKVDMKEAEGEENQAAIDYQRVMADAKMAREADMKSLTEKRVVLARNKEQLAQYQSELDLVNKELKNLEVVLLSLHLECDFITKNYPAQHAARVDQDVSGKEIFNLIKHPIPSRAEVEQQFEDEKTMKDVAANYPNQTITEEIKAEAAADKDALRNNVRKDIWLDDQGHYDPNKF
eukprot:gnl/MRDRNA2_/MRDRNA2_87753_c0_seq1.p1 gnl/MRDRNA2_/MRDRNA2_87753_c0~~gnl/MRDRNA2_/MRDRNA2_87753_c0_seq1.p1  ORF type:complete len:889 (+),score=260.98 gnl/MRDRNA2_/MRDRNA2_87753_c0_seq1:92-2758(+)